MKALQVYLASYETDFGVEHIGVLAREPKQARALVWAQMNDDERMFKTRDVIQLSRICRADDLEEPGVRLLNL